MTDKNTNRGELQRLREEKAARLAQEEEDERTGAVYRRVCRWGAGRPAGDQPRSRP